MMPRFRAWDKELEQMVYDVQATYDGLEYSKANKDIDIDSYDWMDCFESWFDGNRFELMQDTKIKDIKGNAIYIGDIVQSTNYYKAEPEKDKGAVYHDEKMGCFKMKSEKYWCGNNISSSEEHVSKIKYEVIGNKYENKELLEDE